MREFLEKNFNWYHLIGMILFTLLSVLYWYISDNMGFVGRLYHCRYGEQRDEKKR